MKNTVASILILMLLLVIWIAFTFSQMYKQSSPTTATKGIFFKTTLKLNEYKNVSSGNGMWGNFDRYTRSDRHTDIITVYCNKYCKK